MSMNAVKAAAAYMDKYSTYENWRELVDRDSLDMYSSDRCVLGQVYGSYGRGQSRLRDESGSVEWSEVSNAFQQYTSDWSEYLDLPVDVYSGKNFSMKGIPSEKATVDHTFLVGNVLHIVYAFQGENFQVRTETSFNNLFVTPPTYVDGRLYISKDRKNVMVYNAPEDEFLKLTNNDNIAKVTHAPVDYMEKAYGPLSELVSTLNSIHGNVAGKLQITFVP